MDVCKLIIQKINQFLADKKFKQVNSPILVAM